MFPQVGSNDHCNYDPWVRLYLKLIEESGKVANVALASEAWKTQE